MPCCVVCRGSKGRAGEAGPQAAQGRQQARSLLQPRQQPLSQLQSPQHRCAHQIHNSADRTPALRALPGLVSRSLHTVVDLHPHASPEMLGRRVCQRCDPCSLLLSWPGELRAAPAAAGWLPGWAACNSPGSPVQETFRICAESVHVVAGSPTSKLASRTPAKRAGSSAYTSTRQGRPTRGKGRAARTWQQARPR